MRRLTATCTERRGSERQGELSRLAGASDVEPFLQTFITTSRLMTALTPSRFVGVRGGRHRRRRGPRLPALCSRSAGRPPQRPARPSAAGAQRCRRPAGRAPPLGGERAPHSASAARGRAASRRRCRGGEPSLRRTAARRGPAQLRARDPLSRDGAGRAEGLGGAGRRRQGPARDPLGARRGPGRAEAPTSARRCRREPLPRRRPPTSRPPAGRTSPAPRRRPAPLARGRGKEGAAAAAPRAVPGVARPPARSHPPRAAAAAGRELTNAPLCVPASPLRDVTATARRGVTPRGKAVWAACLPPPPRPAARGAGAVPPPAEGCWRERRRPLLWGRGGAAGTAGPRPGRSLAAPGTQGYVADLPQAPRGLKRGLPFPTSRRCGGSRAPSRPHNRLSSRCGLGPVGLGIVGRQVRKRSLWKVQELFWEMAMRDLRAPGQRGAQPAGYEPAECPGGQRHPGLYQQ